MHTNIKAAAAAGTVTATRRPDERTGKVKERSVSGLRARKSRQRHLQEIASQLGTKADITSGERGGALQR
jgi:hypothetical protein